MAEGLHRMFKFYYAFIMENVSNIERGFGDSVYKSIKPQLDNYMGKIFEDICMSYLQKKGSPMH